MITKESIGISVVLGTYNRFDLLKLTIQSIRDELKDFLNGYEIIVIDGGSTDGSMEWLITQKDIITIIQHNRGEWLGKPIERKSWGYFMNLGFKAAQGKYICMVSDDCLIVPGAIRNGYDLFEQKLKQGKKVGGVAFYYRNYPFDNQYFVQIPHGKMIINHGLYLRSALQKINFIDEEAYKFYYADADLSFRLWKAGFLIIDSPTSFIEHYMDEKEKIRNENSTVSQQDANVFNKRWFWIVKWDALNIRIRQLLKINDKCSIRLKLFDDKSHIAQFFDQYNAKN